MAGKSDLHSKIMRRAEFDEIRADNNCVMYATRNSDRNPNYKYFVEGARWQSQSLAPLIEALASCAKALEFAQLNSRLCSDHAQGNNVPFCTNECEIKRNSATALSSLAGIVGEG